MYHGYVELMRRQAAAKLRKGRKRKGRKSGKRKSRRDSRVTAWSRAVSQPEAIIRALSVISGGKRRGRKSRGSRSTIMSRRTRRKLNRERHRSLMKKTRKWSKKARSRYATGGDYISYKRARKAAFGPVPFALQPTWVRSYGRKGKAKTKAAKKRARRKSRKSGSPSRYWPDGELKLWAAMGKKSGSY